jgi:hypothetical protein
MTEPRADVIKYADGSEAAVCRYAILVDGEETTSYSTSKRAAFKEARILTAPWDGLFTRVDVAAFDHENVTRAIWPVVTGTTGKRIDP